MANIERLTLFDIKAAPPTTRDVAELVKKGGTKALADADLRADAARYQEISCRSALNQVQGMPFKWTLNPYRGCTHGCHYCFARRYHAQFEMNAGDEFASVILVKRNIVDVLQRELDRPTWSQELVAFGTATDPYQPIEGHYRLTRRSLEALARARTPVALVTKGPMVVRDCDVLNELSRRAGCSVYVSVPTTDEDAWRRLEPGTAHPLRRLRAVRKLADAGIDAGVLMAPIVPGVSSSARKLERTVKAIADHGVRFVGCSVMYLQDGTRDHFFQFLGREFPSLVSGYLRLYERTYPPKAYTERLKALVHAMHRQHGLDRGRDTHAKRVSGHGPGRSPDSSLMRQAGFEWTVQRGE